MKQFYAGIETLLHEQVDVVGVLNISDTQNDTDELLRLFVKYKDYNFLHNQRLILCHPDLDYYPSLQSSGNTLYNTITIISNLNISTDHIVLLTRSIDQHQEVNALCDMYNLSRIKVLNFNLWYTMPPKNLSQVEIKFKKQYLFSFLNGVPRTHRQTMYAWLMEYDLCSYGSISWHQTYSTSTQKSTEENVTPNCQINDTLRTTWPSFTRINENLGVNNLTKQLQLKHRQCLQKNCKTKNIPGTPNSRDTFWVAPYLQDALVYVISETVGDYPYVFLTEKTWKAITSFTPFVIAGPKNCLAYLQDIGFKTFSHLWDESYDSEETFYKRAEKIAALLNSLKEQDWAALFEKCVPVLEHNYNHLETLKANEIKNLKEILSN